MHPDLLFTLATRAALAGWVLLAVAPRWRWTTRLISSVLIPGLLAALYAALILVHWGDAEGGFGSLDEVAELFRNRHILLAGWIHYLAFDLFTGAWEVRDAQRLGIHHGLVIPCLALTFLFGPAGLLLYLLLRAVVRRSVLLGGDRAQAAR